jgi:hypothetical protein
MPNDPCADGQAFFAWVQNERDAAGFAVEKWPKPERLSFWFSKAMTIVKGDGRRLMAALHAFAEDEHWRSQNAPFNAFMSEFQRYVPPLEAFR